MSARGSEASMGKVAVVPLARRHSNVESDRVPWQITVFVVLTVLLPIEFGFRVGSLYFTWSKAYLLLMSVVIFSKLRVSRLYFFDWLIIAHVAWSFAAYIIGFGLANGLQTGGTYILEFLSVYMLVRIYLGTLNQFVAVVNLLFWLVLISTILALPEAVVKIRFIHESARALTGITQVFYDEERFGLLRAAVAFEHPILFGMFCAALLGPVWFASRGVARLLKSLVVGAGTFLSLSSAPLLLYVAQVGLIAAERATRSLKHRLALLVSAFVSLVVALEMFTGRGAIGSLTVIMLNPDTAWYRKAQIDYSIDDLVAHPLFGVGSGTWSRPFWLNESIDNHFLAIGIRSGLPAVFFLLAALFMLWRTLARVDAARQPPLFQQLRTGWGLMTIALVLGGVTVTYFGVMQPLLAFYIGLGGALVAAAARVAPAQHGADRSVGRRSFVSISAARTESDPPSSPDKRSQWSRPPRVTPPFSRPVDPSNPSSGPAASPDRPRSFARVKPAKRS